ncbi:hypothetical protein F2Q69_00023553 [Brassica cretica]|uniref:Uncharacterized protein n=1 Tax=Brassica cretica TaxID=69181 RepID=A0A8S9QHG7_BRACR|nr:hypothetical protein F2Q69_00023553 [Brassica cretica]
MLTNQPSTMQPSRSPTWENFPIHVGHLLCFLDWLQSDKQQNLPTIGVMRKRFHWKLVKPSMPGPATDQNKRKRPVSDFPKAI